MQRLIGKPEGVYIAGSRCYRVAKLFDECTPRREEICIKAANLYKAIYAGGCTIIYEVDVELCRAAAKLKKS